MVNEEATEINKIGMATLNTPSSMNYSMKFPFKQHHQGLLLNGYMLPNNLPTNSEEVI